MRRDTWRVQGWLAAFLIVTALGASPGVVMARRASSKQKKPAPQAPNASGLAILAPNRCRNTRARSARTAPPAFGLQPLRLFVPGRYQAADSGAGHPKSGRELRARVHPWEGLGPWFSYDRTQWHKNQLPLLRACGVDVLLPVYRGDTASRAAYAIKGLDCLSQALKELRQEREQPHIRGRDYPLVGMYFDTGSVETQLGAPPDMKTEEARRTFYGMVREFFLHIPPEFRATVPLPPERARAQTARFPAASSPRGPRTSSFSPLPCATWMRPRSAIVRSGSPRSLARRCSGWGVRLSAAKRRGWMG